MVSTVLPGAVSPVHAVASQAAQHADQPQIIERLAVSARFQSDGTSEITTHARVRVQSEAGVRYFGQLAFPYSAAVQDVLLDQVRVHKSGGQIVTAGVEAVQD